MSILRNKQVALAVSIGLLAVIALGVSGCDKEEEQAKGSRGIKCGQKAGQPGDCRGIKCGQKAGQPGDCRGIKCGSKAGQPGDCRGIKCGSKTGQSGGCYRISGPINVLYVYETSEKSATRTTEPKKASEILIFEECVVITEENGSSRLIPITKIRKLSWTRDEN